MKALLAIALGAAGCGSLQGSQVPAPKHQLEGSLSTILSLGYDDVAFEETSDDFSVHFIRHRGTPQLDGGGQADDTPLKVTYAKLGEDPFGVGVKVFDLTAARPNMGDQRAVLSRNVDNDPNTRFPPIRIGSLTFNTVPAPGRTVGGKFNVTFENGVDFSSGTTVFGTFDAKAQ